MQYTKRREQILHMEMMEFIDKHGVELTTERISTIIERKIDVLDRQDKQDPFIVCDLGSVIRQYKNWISKLPRVEPFYAIKSNDSLPLLELFVQLGFSFDCASKGEIEKILRLNVAPSRIIYANPYKQESFIRYAAENNVQLMTFDDETELHKVKNHFPDAKLVVRILPPISDKCIVELGKKFGCHPKRVPHLLELAKQLNLNVVGVSFHVGSGCYDPAAFSAAVKCAREMFDIARTVGYQFSLLDIGGGFPSESSATDSFDETACTLRESLDLYFPEQMGVRIIAEPGRYFVASSFTLATNVVGRRIIPDSDTSALDEEKCDVIDPRYVYYINDGIFGTMSCIVYDFAVTEPLLLDWETKIDKHRYKSTIMGPTCNCIDVVVNDCLLPKLEIGDWIVFPDVGAYTVVSASYFGGMTKPKCYYILPEQYWSVGVQ